ncbi:RNA-binding S4 domain-containing protein [Alkalibacter saccharofermentans]|uniref:RQC P-site tRNA stabilizing factor n=1 Tax=Alkalibacter saccharofermentans DSM 14828 TaxID=1120975 RepID=A0A1M4YD53_9FIRM|nr:RNA-binding S4 domain-containing protein [Alkalibacter saccharofermentans]SHF03685.1 Ribosomal 50S subunit-recycling heat shock protein, contains S4 domain [Alkalibacter saccharofermentans DSM 14828]
MRLDKYLKTSRLIKRRTLAKEACDKGKITVNGNAAKAGTDIKVGDEIAITLGARTMTVVVESLTEHVKKEEAQNMYKVKEQP